MSESSTSSSTTASSNNNTRRNGVTTRYWDCCKPSCAWTGKASVTNPVQTCAMNGVTPIDVNTQSGCTSGTAFTCDNQQPWSINATFAYGYVGVHLTVCVFFQSVINLLFFFFIRAKSKPIGVALVIR